MSDRDKLLETRDSLQAIVSNLNAYLSGGPINPPSGGDVVSITTMPTPNWQMGQSIGGGPVVGGSVVPNQIVGAGFEILDGTQNRQITFYGQPAQFFTRYSWGIFNANNGVWICGQNNQVITGSVGVLIQIPDWAALNPGMYVFACAVNSPGKLAMQFVQN